MSATVKIHDVSSPSEQVVAKALAEVKVKDSQGRIFTLRKPGFLAQFDLVEVAGEAANIDRYMMMITPLIYVAAIDDDPIGLPKTKLALRGLVTRIGEDAFNIITKTINDTWMPKTQEEAKKNSES